MIEAGIYTFIGILSIVISYLISSSLKNTYHNLCRIPMNISGIEIVENYKLLYNINCDIKSDARLLGDHYSPHSNSFHFAESTLDGKHIGSYAIINKVLNSYIIYSNSKNKWLKSSTLRVALNIFGFILPYILFIEIIINILIPMPNLLFISLAITSAYICLKLYALTYQVQSTKTSTQDLKSYGISYTDSEQEYISNFYRMASLSYIFSAIFAPINTVFNLVFYYLTDFEKQNN